MREGTRLVASSGTRAGTAGDGQGLQRYPRPWRSGEPWFAGDPANPLLQAVGRGRDGQGLRSACLIVMDAGADAADPSSSPSLSRATPYWRHASARFQGLTSVRLLRVWAGQAGPQRIGPHALRVVIMRQERASPTDVR